MADLFDFSEVTDFARELGELPRDTIHKVRQGIEYAAHATDDAWTAASRPLSGAHARFYPTTIDYDLDLNTNGEISAEVGPNLGRKQGSLGILETGAAVNAAPQNAIRKAAKVAEKELEIGVLKALGDVL